MAIVGIVGNVRDAAVFLVKTMEQVVYDSTTGTRLVSRLLTIFSALALVLALIGVYVLRGFIIGMSAPHVATCAGAAALVLGVALAASFVAARGASRVDPLAALRHE